MRPKRTPKSKRPAWLATTATAYDIICIIRDGLDDDQQIEPSMLRIVAESIRLHRRASPASPTGKEDAP
jgi:hypothetical protein